MANRICYFGKKIDCYGNPTENDNDWLLTECLLKENCPLGYKKEGTPYSSCIVDGNIDPKGLARIDELEKAGDLTKKVIEL